MQMCVVQNYRLPFVIQRRGEKLQDGELLGRFCSCLVSHLGPGTLNFLLLDPAFVTLVKVARDMTQEAATTKHPLQCRVSFVLTDWLFQSPASLSVL
jgi:hypothetical protein